MESRLNKQLIAEEDKHRVKDKGYLLPKQSHSTAENAGKDSRLVLLTHYCLFSLLPLPLIPSFTPCSNCNPTTTRGEVEEGRLQDIPLPL